MHPIPRLARRIQLAAAGAGVALGAIATAWLLTLALARPTSPVPTSEPALAVRLLRGAETIRLAPGPELTIGPASGDPNLTLRPPARLAIRDGQWVLEGRGDDHRRIAPADAALVLRADDPIALASGATLPATLRLRARSDLDRARFDVIADLGLERYVAGVVSAETYAGWGAEALKAQAVAARSYAINERNAARARRRHHDIDAGTGAQALNLDARDDAARAAAATRGVVLTTDDGVLRAYYASTCGGRPASAADTWQGGDNDAAPIQAKERAFHCESSPLFRWSIERPTAVYSARLGAWGRDHGHAVAAIGLLRSVDVVERNPARRPTRYVLRDSRAERYSIHAESLRLASNQPVGDDRPDVRVWSSDLAVSVDGPTVTIDGRGFGHGVGLCQFGAAAMAERGDLWPAILGHFYPGAQLQRAYE